MSAAPAVVVGAGIAGLTTALVAARHGCAVIVLCDVPPGDGGSSPMAQGGMAAAIGTSDSPVAHWGDTLAAGGETVDPAVAATVCDDGPDAVAWLMDIGARFDCGPDGALALHREAAHSQSRVVHHGDATGAEITRALVGAVGREPAIEVRSEVVALEVVQRAGMAAGVQFVHRAGGHAEVVLGSAVVLATGGYGHLWARTTNPPQVCGDGVAMAVRAGADVADLEMVQFHPTALDVAADPRPLLTEALRGAGAHLVNEHGERFCFTHDARGELAPRDIVARAVHAHLASGHRVYLDTRLLGAGLVEFPAVAALVMQHGLQFGRDLLPVTPVAHYCMGGIVTDDRGRTTLPGLWAVGEVAATGLHGANRLASNSLLEAVAVGRRAGKDIAAHRAGATELAAVPSGPAMMLGDPHGVVTRVREILDRHVGVVRDAAGLAAAAAALEAIDPGRAREAVNAVTVARLVVQFASRRTESRGAHTRADHPYTDPSQARRQVLAGVAR